MRRLERIDYAKINQPSAGRQSKLNRLEHETQSDAGR